MLARMLRRALDYLVPERKVVFPSFPTAAPNRPLCRREAESEISGELRAPNDQLQRFRQCSNGPISTAGTISNRNRELTN